MKLPKDIEAEIDKEFHSLVRGTVRRIAHMVAADCARLCDDDFERKAIRQRYGLDEQTGDPNDPN